MTISILQLALVKNGFLAEQGTFENEAVVEHELSDHPITSILDGINFWVGGPLGCLIFLFPSQFIIDEVQIEISVFFSTIHYWTTLVLEEL